MTPMPQRAIDREILEDDDEAKCYRPPMSSPENFEEDDQEREGSSEEIEAAWAAEIQRRMDELDNGTVKAIPWSEVEEMLAETRAELRAKPNR